MNLFSCIIVVLWCLVGLSIHGKAVNYDGAVTVVEQEDETVIENEPESSDTDTENIEPIKYELFQPTNEWQTVRDDQAIPPGLHVRMNLETGKKEAKLMDGQPDYNSWRDGDRHGILNMDRKQLSMNELKKALKDFKTTELDDTDLEREAEVKEKFKSYDDLKKDFSDMNMNIKTDAEIIEGLLTKMKHKDTSGDDKLTILTDLEYYLHQIDNAVLFKDMGGIPHVLSILNTSDVEGLQIEAALVLGAATSSNPKVQIGALEAGALPLLLRLLSVNSSLNLKRKLIFCLSALCRHFPYAQKRFLKLGGLVALRNVFDEPGIEKIKVKTVSLLNDLVLEKKLTVENSNTNVSIDTEKIKQYKQVNLLEAMIDQGWCGRVMSLLQLTDHESREHVLNTMQTLMKSCRTTFIESTDDLISLRAEYLELSQHEEIGDDYFTSILSVINHLLHDVGIKNEL